MSESQEQTNIEVRVINPDMLILLDALRKNTQIELDSKDSKQILEESKSIDPTLISLSHSAVFIKVKYTPELSDLFSSVNAIANTVLNNTKEVFMLQKEGEAEMVFSYRIWRILSELEPDLERLTIKHEDIKESVKDSGVLDLLKGKLQLIQTEEDMNVIIGKAHRETWDMLHDLGYAYTSFRALGCSEKGDKFSGFICLFSPQIEKAKKFMATDITVLKEDLDSIFEAK